MIKTFRTILIDPPWPERGGGKIKRGADRHYRLLGPRRILDVVQDSGLFRPARDAHLYIWSTNNYLPKALWLIERLGFAYKTTIVWAKPRFGLGQYFRGQTELLLFAVRGRGIAVRRRTPGKDLTTLVAADHVCDDRRKIFHSAKPDGFHRMIERQSPTPRLEMFARRCRRGWVAWGDQVGLLRSEVRS